MAIISGQEIKDEDESQQRKTRESLGDNEGLSCSLSGTDCSPSLKETSAIVNKVGGSLDNQVKQKQDFPSPIIITIDHPLCACFRLKYTDDDENKASFLPSDNNSATSSIDTLSTLGGNNLSGHSSEIKNTDNEEEANDQETSGRIDEESPNFIAEFTSESSSSEEEEEDCSWKSCSSESSSAFASNSLKDSSTPCISNKLLSTSLPVLNSVYSYLLLPSHDRHLQHLLLKDTRFTEDSCLLCHRSSVDHVLNNIFIPADHIFKGSMTVEEEESLIGTGHSRLEAGYGANRSLFSGGNNELPERPAFRSVRRALSLSSSYPEARIGRTRKLFCPRQPPTKMQRTLSISRTNLSIKSKTRRLSSYQKMILFCLSLVSFTSFLCMSIMAPFFPKVAAEKGMSGAVSGFVFSCYALVVMIASPILGHLLPRVGAKFMLLSGIFAAGVASILFGLLNHISGTMEFTIYCFIVRSVEAVGAAAFSTASYTYIMYIFPDDIGTAFGLTETCVGVGMSLGPAIGSGLFTLGGYGLPFYTLGAMILINIPICWYIVRPIDELSQSEGFDKKDSNTGDDPERTTPSPTSYFSLVTIPQVAVISLVVVVVSQSQGFLDPTVEPHFRQYNLGTTGFVGIVFLLMSFAYAVLSPITGWIATKMENKYPLMIIGLLLSSLGLVLLGPSSFIPVTPNVWMSTISMVIMGFAYAVAFIPTFECILDLAIEKGFADNVKTYSLVSGLWSSMYSLGEVSGPLFGGLFVDVFDFRHGVTVMAGFSFIAVSFPLHA
jgi:MFS family permease